MAENLVFPIRFDLESAVKEASGDVDKVLRRLETRINSRPLKINIEGGFSNMGVVGDIKDSLESVKRAQQMLARDGSITAMRKEMSALITEWEKLSEAERTATDASGKFAGRAGEIVRRFAELTTAANTHARSLNQLVAAADKAAAAEEKAARKRAETASRLAVLKKPDMDSLSEVKASLKYYEQLAGSAKQFSAGWEICVQRIKELKARSQELSDIYKAMTRQNVFNMPEGNLNEVRNKIKALKIQMEQATPKSDAWNDFSNQLSRLREVEKGMAADQKQAIKTESELRAEREKAALQELANQRKIKAERARNVSDVERERASRQQLIAQKRQELAILNGEEKSLDQVNAKLEIRRRLLASSKEGTRFYDSNWKEVNRLEEKQRGMQSNTPDAQRKAQEQLQREWLAAKDQREREREKETEKAIAAANRENQARQAAYNAQRQAGLERQRILNLEENSIANITAKLQLQQERLNNARFGTAKYEKIRQEVEQLTISLQEAQKKLAEMGQRLAALRALREILAANEKTVDGLNQKLQYFQERLSRLETGSGKWTRTAAEVRRLSDELERANQKMRDFQNAAFKGLSANFTAQQTEAVTRLRSEIDAIDRKFNMLYQNKRATNADGSYNDRVKAMLDERIAKEKEIGRILTTAADAAIKREQELNAVTERRKRMLDDMRRKEQEHDKAKGERRALAIAEQRRKAAGGLTKEQEKRQKLLNLEENTINNIQKKLAYYQQKLKGQTIDSKGFEKTAKEVERLTTKLRTAQKEVDALTGKQTRGSQRASAEYSKQLTYVDRLIRRMAVYASVGMLGNFLTQVREVTAQFELQRVSLGAIIQDQNKANQLFSEIKSFALKSPVSILDLTKYTKQLAAYKVGFDGVKTDTKELFDWTKKLTDVSVGLGVSMDRVVLAFGQVRATGHLRASEIRQFTEMGVPIVEELAAKLTKMNGELVTAAEVMDLVSKRGISFEMVKEVFDDMTSAGGIFYNMQEKQGNTLYGLWAKLGDAASVMYEQIGNTGIINSAMKTLIGSMTWLMKNWRLMIGEIGAAAVGFGTYRLMQSLVTVNTVAASKATRDYARAQIQLNAAQKGSIWGAEAAAKASMRAAAANRAAAASTSFMTAATLRLKAAWNQLKAAFLGNWVALAVTALAAIGIAIAAAWEKTTRLNRELSKIKEETGVLQAQSVRNFEHLANAAVKAADGSRKQKDALDELQRTYGDILPAEAMSIENLRAMKGDYEELTRAIRENIAAQQESKALEEIKNEYSPKIIEAQRDAEKALSKAGFGDEEIDRFFRNITDHYRELADRLRSGEKIDIMGELLNMSGMERSKLSARQYMEVANAYTKIVNAQEAWIQKENAVRSAYEQSTVYLGEYTRSMQNYNDWVQKNMNSGETMLQNQQNVNMQILGMESMIQQAMEKAGLAWNEGWANIVTSVDPNDLNRTTTLNIDAILAAIDPNKYPELHKYISEYKRIYDGLIPSDPTVRQIRAKFFSVTQSLGASMQKMQQFLWDGSGSVDDYLERLKDQQEKLTALLKEKEQTLLNWSWIDAFLNGKTKEQVAAEIAEIKKQIQALNTLVPFVTGYTVPEKSKSKGGGSKSDTRLQELQELYNTLKAINKEYDDLSKKEGKSKAGSWIVENYEPTLKRLNDLARKFKLNFDFPLTPESLQKYGTKIIDKIKSLNLKGGDKAVIDLQLELAKDTQARLEKEIERQLKELSDRISRTKTAKEFYEKILGMTGDVELAANLSLSIYGENGEDLEKAIRDNIQATLGKNREGVDLDFSAAIRADGSVDYNALTKIAKGYLDMEEISEATYDKILKMRDEDRKDLAKTVEEWMKATEKAKSYSDNLLDLRRRTQREIDRINEKEARGQISSVFAESQRTGFLRKEAEEVAKLQYEAFKDSPMYVQMFDDLENASTTMLRNMKQRIEELKTSWKDLTPTQLKEMQSRLNEIDSQLAKRNPFKGLIDGIKEYRELRKVGDDLGNKSEGAAEKALDAAAKARLEAEKEYLEILNKEGATQEEIAKAKERFDKAAADEDAAAKAVENWKKVKDVIGLSANELFQMLNWAGDIARAVSDISEALGADEEDVQYWNDLAEALGQISGGIQDIVSAAMGGNVVGVISSTLTAIPKMFVGFANLFSAGKIKRANKEIRRQQELLDQLEYTYGRLEAAADRLFGRDYLNNYNQQLEVLQAQQEAYLKQAEAERSKGKKADEEQIKEYENQARETADNIKELQEDLVTHFTGSSRTDVARQMAESWIDARGSMSDTFSAIKGDYAEMIRNMIVEGAAARVIENALSPVWDSMESMLAENDVEGAIDSLVNGMDSALSAANDGMEVLWKALEARGYDMKQLVGDTDSEYTGIAKSVAGATSEEINGVAAIGNTLMYYVSPIPRMDENLARVVAILEGGVTPSGSSAASSEGWTDWQRQAMENYNAIARNTAETVAECRRAAEACERMTRTIRTKGSTSGLNVFVNS